VKACEENETLEEDCRPTLELFRNESDEEENNERQSKHTVIRLATEGRRDVGEIVIYGRYEIF